jgi:small GTP-binding protein
MADDFKYDVFLSHSSKDATTVRAIAERLKKDGLRVWLDAWEIRPGDSIPAKIEAGLEQSRVLVLCMSANAFGSDWAQLETGTFRFRDPLNKDRRFVPIRLDGAPVKGSLAQFAYVNWPADEGEYTKLVEVCRPPETQRAEKVAAGKEHVAEWAVDLHDAGDIWDYAFSADGKRVLSAGDDGTVRLWNVSTGTCVREFKGHTGPVYSVAWSADESHALSGGTGGEARVWDVQTGGCIRTLGGKGLMYVWGVAWSADGGRILTGSQNRRVCLWDTGTGRCLHVLKGHTNGVNAVLLSGDGRRALSGSDDKTIRLWEVGTGACLRVLEGSTSTVCSIAWSVDDRRALSGSADGTLLLWDIETESCLRVLEGHTNQIWRIAWNTSQRFALSASFDKTVRLWDIETGSCLQVLVGHTNMVRGVAWSGDQRHALSGDMRGGIRRWDLSQFVSGASSRVTPSTSRPVAPDQVQHTNAKVLLVGDTGAGKTGLAHRLATGEWKPSEGSTVGAWSTQWKLEDPGAEPGVEREIWLWDFGGQADQRLIHQLYMDRTALILQLFNADQEDVLPGLRDWQTALRRCVPGETPQLLVAGRIDAGYKASRSKLQRFAREVGASYYETSALDGTGCGALRAAILFSIPWASIPVTTTERLFKVVKDEILKLRDEGQSLLTLKKLRELLRQRLPEQFTDETLHAVIRLLDGPGVVRELDYGTYILLKPEWINAYGQAVIRTLRSNDNELGTLPLRSIVEGKLIYQSVGRNGELAEMKRLPPAEERIVLGEMERLLVERGLCLQQGDKLVFPSHCGRDRPAVVEHPSVFVSYEVKGYLDDIYTTLVVKLADSQSFKLHELWRDAADFDTLVDGCRMGIKLTRETGSSGDISVYFGPGVTEAQQVIFATYIHTHLESRCEQVQRLRQYVCPKCNTPKGNPQVLRQKLLARKDKADTECDKCGKRFNLWDGLEKKFASKSVFAEVMGLDRGYFVRLDARRKGKLLVLEVGARVLSANQKSIEIPATEDEGLDMELEFTDDDGRGTGQRVYLQLKAGNSHLTRRKDGVEIFKIKKQRWVTYWLKQPQPVMLVIGTFPEERERYAGRSGREKLEFADVRWMEISSVLRRESENGTKPVRQIEFAGERLDMESVHRWRKKVLGQVLQ